MSQVEYVEKAFNRFNMHDAKPINTPLVSYFRLLKEDSPKIEKKNDYMSRVSYASVIDSLMYVLVNTRPNITQTVGVVSRFMSKPRKMHWEAVKYVLRYLKGTTNTSLSFGGKEIQVQRYVDSDLSGDKDNSTTGYVFTLGDTAASWVYQLQKIVTLSSLEVEYIAATEASK